MSDRIVLVTSVGGGGVGEQLVKALRLAERPYRIIGADAQTRSLGLADVDVPLLVPLASAPDYVETMLAVCTRLGIRGVFPGSEQELVSLAGARTRFAEEGITLFANNDAVIAFGLDKGRTVEALAHHGFRPPMSVIVTNESDLGAVTFLPAVLKPIVSGGGSANVFIAQTPGELRLFGTYLLASYPRFLVQEYLGSPNDEYTVGVLSDLDGTLINSIAVRRNILSAFSNRLKVANRTGNPAFGPHLVISNGISQGEIGPFPEVTSACERIAAALGSSGPLNVQCRLVDGEVRVFEINPRFSGTTSLRAMVGFNEPDLLYVRHVEGEAVTPRFAYASGYIGRGLREVVTDPALEGARVAAGDFRWQVSALPFIYRPLETPSNGAGLPDVVPLTLTVNPGTGLLHQVPEPEVARALERAYAVGSEIPGLMEAQGIGRDYADDFLGMLFEGAQPFPVEGRRILEIGCGTGYLLSRLQELGATVLGVEPGPHGALGPARHGVPVVRAYFPTPEVEGRYDLVILYLMLEHVPDPETLLQQVRSHLAPGGRVAVVVPDAGPFLDEGDASILFHEHYSYFTATTLPATVRALGARSLRIRRSTLSRLLFCEFSFEGDDEAGVLSPRGLMESLAQAHRFRTTVEHTVRRISAYLSAARAQGDSVGIYVPGRFVNYVTLGGLPLNGVRFFDDSPALHGRYFPGIPVPVESREALLAEPTSHLLVMSASFGERIVAQIAPRLPARTRVTTLGALLK
jgi:carbamoyl-phosphate synthase large subunit